MSYLTPSQVAQTALDHLRAHNMDAFTELFGDEAVMEFPFAPTNRVQRLEGRRAVEHYLAGYPEMLDIHDVHDVSVHRTEDEHVVIVEFAVRGTVVATSMPYTTRYVAVLTIVDGLIRHYRDYWDPTVFTTVPIGRKRSA